MYNTLKIISLHSAEQKNCQKKTYLAIRATEEKYTWWKFITQHRKRKGRTNNIRLGSYKQNSDKSENGKKLLGLSGERV